MDRFAALSDPTRFRILEMLAESDLSAGDIADQFKMTAPAISQHLKVLRDAGLVRMRAQAQRRIYALDADALHKLEDVLGTLRRNWMTRQKTKAADVEPVSAGTWDSILNRLGA
jgi:DNA-binding transcriptional ArsR family regulator